LNVTDEPSVVRSLSVARRYWHTVSPTSTTACANIEVWVEELASTEAFGKVLAPTAVTQVGGCRMAVSPTFWRYRLGRSDREAMLCLLITHEYGHVVGLGDVFTEGNIMNLNPSLSLLPACSHLEVPQGRNAPLPSCHKITLSIPCAKRAIILAQEHDWGPEALVVSVTECERIRRSIVCNAEMRGTLVEYDTEGGEAAVSTASTTWPVEAIVRLVHGTLRVRSGI
jgi:hypothetical protein